MKGITVESKSIKTPKMKIPKHQMRIRAMRWMKKNSPDMVKLPKV
jgi:hypothetical protein